MQQNNSESLLAEFKQRYQDKIRVASLKMNIHLLLSALADEALEPTQLAAVLQQYPVISARLIGLANSPWVRPVSPITNVESACIRLGSAQVKAVSIAIAVASSFNTARCPAFNPIRFWTTSILVAEGAVLLALNLPDKDCFNPEKIQTLKTGGILHNLGLLWLADLLAEEMEQTLRLTNVNPSLSVNQALLQGIGIDSCTIGAWVAKQWHIPDELVEIIAFHRDMMNQEILPFNVLLVGAAARMVSALFHESPVTEDLTLSALNIESGQQQNIFEQLTNKLNPTLELARLMLM